MECGLPSLHLQVFGGAREDFYYLMQYNIGNSSGPHDLRASILLSLLSRYKTVRDHRHTTKPSTLQKALLAIDLLTISLHATINSVG